MRAILLSILLLWAPFSLAEGKLKAFDAEAPGLELTDLSGQMHRLSDYPGSIVMVQFWATYCTPCRTEMPAMNRLEKQLDGKLKILAINMGESEADVQRFVDEVKPEFTVLLDPQGKSIQAWKAFAVPTSFIVGPDGRIHYTLYGPAEWDSPEIVDQLLTLMEG